MTGLVCLDCTPESDGAVVLLVVRCVKQVGPNRAEGLIRSGSGRVKVKCRVAINTRAKEVKEGSTSSLCGLCFAGPGPSGHGRRSHGCNTGPRSCKQNARPRWSRFKGPRRSRFVEPLRPHTGTMESDTQTKAAHKSKPTLGNGPNHMIPNHMIRPGKIAWAQGLSERLHLRRPIGPHQPELPRGPRRRLPSLGPPCGGKLYARNTRFLVQNWNQPTQPRCIFGHWVADPFRLSDSNRKGSSLAA